MDAVALVGQARTFNFTSFSQSFVLTASDLGDMYPVALVGKIATLT